MQFETLWRPIVGTVLPELHFASSSERLNTEMREVQPWFTIVTKKPNSGLLTGKPFPHHISRKRGKPVQTSRSYLACSGCEGTFNQELVCPSQMVNSITTWRFSNIWAEDLPKIPSMMVEQGLVDSPWQCTGTFCFLYHWHLFWPLKMLLWYPTLPTSLNRTLLTSCFWGC